MAQLGRKTKIGSMLGVDLGVLQPTTEVEPAKKEKNTEVKKQETRPAAKQPSGKTDTNTGGRPRFDIVKGKEIRMNFHCPHSLYHAIVRESANQLKTHKQLICEILFDALTSRGHVIVDEEVNEGK